MGFYEALSEVYDIVFPKNEVTLTFLSKELPKKSTVLDIACGTGNYTTALADLGHRVDGIDLDPKMIDLAKEKAEGLPVRLMVGDMTGIEEVFEGQSYDMAYCIGNSLVHLQNKEVIREFITKLYDRIQNNGQCIIQIVNYDRILNHNLDHLPTIDKKEKGVTFVRNYRYDQENHLMHFDTALILSTQDGEKNYHHSVPLIPLRSGELVEMLKEAGFSKIALFGGFNEDAYTDTSFATVVRAVK